MTRLKELAPGFFIDVDKPFGDRKRYYILLWVSGEGKYYSLFSMDALCFNSYWFTHNDSGDKIVTLELDQVEIVKDE